MISRGSGSGSGSMASFSSSLRIISAGPRRVAQF
eukprot:COSAG05_NODE_7999_length_747_cov_1.074074_1_plen_33_part_10